MASLILVQFSFSTSSWCSSTSSCKKPAPFLPSLSSFSSLISYPKTLKLGPSSLSPQLGHVPFPLWSGLKNLGISITPISHQKGRKGKCKGRVVVKASLFGVGAPEVLVIGVVALLVFGPKGLAEVARNLGKTLRAFQPTIRELQEVSREFKSTLEQEIGLDEISSSMQNTSSTRTNIASTPSTDSVENSASVSDVNGASSPRRAYTSEEYLNITEQQLKAVAAQEQQEQSAASQLETQNEPNVGATPLPPKPDNQV